MRPFVIDEVLGMNRPPVAPAGHPSPGITGYARLLAAICRLIPVGSARDEKKPTVDMSNKYAGVQEFYGSDGTQTRDLRRDRPVKVLPG
jgi:hypothetical protein